MSVTLTIFIILSLVDAWVTDKIIKLGGKELNPLMGERPTLTRILLVKVLSLISMIGITHYFNLTHLQDALLSGLIVLYISIIIRNLAIFKKLNRD